MDDSSFEKVSMLTQDIGMVYSGIYNAFFIYIICWDYSKIYTLF